MVSPYKILQAIEKSPDSTKFISDDYNFYRIEDEILERDNLIVETGENSVVFPDKLVTWNHIVGGQLLYVNDEFIADPLNKVGRCDIVMIDSYKKDYLPYVRKAGAIISIGDNKASELYSKCVILNKPCICYLTDEERDLILPYVNQDITVDSRRRKIYHDDLIVINVEKDDPLAAFQALQSIKEQDPEAYDRARTKAKDTTSPHDVPQIRGQEDVDHMKRRLVSDFTDGLQTRFQLDYILDSKNSKALLVYVNDELTKQDTDYSVEDGSVIVFDIAPARGSTIYIGGEFLVLKESKLVAIYEFSEEDIANQETPIEVDLPQPIDRSENVVLVSYTGKLEYEKDYELDFDRNVAILKIKPLVDEIVQFFYYV